MGRAPPATRDRARETGPHRGRAVAPPGGGGDVRKGVALPPGGGGGDPPVRRRVFRAVFPRHPGPVVRRGGDRPGLRKRGPPSVPHGVGSRAVLRRAGRVPLPRRRSTSFGGKGWGRRRLPPTISPNKTVEGSFGGLTASIVFGTGYGVLFLPGVPPWFLCLASAVVGVAGQAGGLFAALLQRAPGGKGRGGRL